MAQKGYIQVHAYTSVAQIPLEKVAIAVTDVSGSAIAFRLTNRSGMLDTPLTLSVQNASESQSPGENRKPYTSIHLYARKENYEQIAVENIQIFPGVITNQNLEMIPLGEFPESWNESETFDTFPQSL